MITENKHIHLKVKGNFEIRAWGGAKSIPIVTVTVNTDYVPETDVMIQTKYGGYSFEIEPRQLGRFINMLQEIKEKINLEEQPRD
jgi:hypothetical protein